MKLPLFKIEDFFVPWEFNVPFLLCTSDVESMTMRELLSTADDETLKLWESLHLGYTETKGMPLLREEISRLFNRISSEEIHCFTGAEEGIFCAMQAIVSPKDHMIVITPCYQSLETVARTIGAEVTMISLDPNQQWILNLNKVKEAMRPTTRLVVINFPHNPTGALIDRETLDELIQLCRGNNAYLFSDEVYRFLEIDEKMRLPSVADLYEKGISLGVLSKAFGLPGLRIGWLASQDRDLLKAIANIKHYTTICGSAPSELLGLIGLRAKDTILERSRTLMLANLQLLDQFFEEHAADMRWVRPKGGCIGFPELLRPEPIDHFFKELVHEEGVLLMPGHIYDVPGNYFRIGFGRRNMPEALKRLERFLAKRR